MTTKTAKARKPAVLNHEPEAVAWAIKRSGYTQRFVAANLGISPGLLSEICNGTRSCAQDLLIEMADLLNCPIVVLESKDNHGQASA